MHASPRIPICLVLLFVVVATLPACGGSTAQAQTNAEPAYHFQVEIEGVDSGAFRSVDGLSVEIEVVEYQNGDDPLTRKRPGRVKYGDITLKRGYLATTKLADWIDSARTGQLQQRTMTIAMIETATGREVKRWNCYECFPTSWKAAPTGGDGPPTEQVEIVVQYFETA